MEPLVSIGLAVYNGENYLRKALDSLLAQDYGNFELIISDNASTDATPEICREYTERDSRVTYHRSPENKGANWNFKRVLELSTSEFFMWAAHDDVWRQDFITKCLQALLAEPEAVVCYCYCQSISADGNLLGIPFGVSERSEDSVSERWLNLHKHWDTYFSIYGLMRREALTRTRLFLAINCADFVFVSEMITQGKILIIPEILHYKRVLYDEPRYKDKREMIAYFGGTAAKRPHMVLGKATLECVRGLKQRNLSRSVYNRLAFAAIFNYLTSYIKTDLMEEFREMTGKYQ